MTKSEVNAYLILLESDSSSATQIAEKAGLYRKNTYDALKKLLKMGLISSVKVKNKQVFTATDPSILLDFMEIRKTEIQKTLPELKAMHKSSSIHPEIMVYYEKEGLKTVLEDIINTNQNYDKLGSEEKFKEIVPSYYHLLQKKRKITRSNAGQYVMFKKKMIISKKSS
jgi:sugar-specific transcriptional regulator TrmB